MTEVILEMETGAVVEGGVWLRKKDYNHINVSNLHAVMKGLI